MKNSYFFQNNIKLKWKTFFFSFSIYIVESKSMKNQHLITTISVNYCFEKKTLLIMIDDILKCLNWHKCSFSVISGLLREIAKLECISFQILDKIFKSR